MSDEKKRRLNWLGTAAIGLGGANLSIYTLNSIIQSQGTAAIPLLVFGLALSIIMSFGYIELVLMYPEKVGGITTACEQAFRPYNPVLTNIIGTGYWFAWLMAASFAAIYAATCIQQFFLPWISVNWLGTTLIIVVTLIHLLGMSWVQRIAIPIAIVAATLAMLSSFIPVLTGQVNWQQATTYSLLSPYPNLFGQLTSIMAGLYIIGWIAPGYEATLCYVGETKNPEKNIPKAMRTNMILALLYYGIYPIIWLGMMEPNAAITDIMQALSPPYAPLMNGFAKTIMAWFLVFNLVICLFAPLGGPPRTLAQLAKDDLLPSFLQKTSRYNVPWIATLITSGTAILIVWLGAPTWLIAATNYQYIICISLSSIAVWLLRRNEPHAVRLYRAPTIMIALGLGTTFIWFIATILGFRQYGLSTMIIGISFSFIGLPFYLALKIHARLKKGLPLISQSLHIKLTGTMITVLILDSIGYLVAVGSIKDTNSELIYIIEDIFVMVAFLTLSIGLAIPGMVVHAAEEVSNATKRLIKTNLESLSDAMRSLGEGNLKKPLEIKEITPLTVSSRDEIGEMAENFNHMQIEINKISISFNEVRERLLRSIEALTELNFTLEKRVEDRTKKLAFTNATLQNEIAERAQAESKNAKLNNELIVAARRAGMADIASSTLHNIGNVLTSVNTSVSLIRENVLQSQLEHFSKAINIIKEHDQDIPSFLTNDPKGKLIPKFLYSLSKELERERDALKTEINDLEKNITHIKTIIIMQQSLSGALGFLEKIDIHGVINEALTLNKHAYENSKIEIIHELASINEVTMDRIRLLQVLVNIVKNSIDSVLEGENEDKKIMISTKPIDDKYFKIEVKDNGIGISSENLTKIFYSAFTTKRQGHGYGLHISSIIATEMGGSLIAKSEGKGKGATLILTLPYSPIQNNNQSQLTDHINI